MTILSKPFPVHVQYLALVTRVWVGVNMMIHGYPKLKNMKQAAKETKLAIGVPAAATYTATILEFFVGNRTCQYWYDHIQHGRSLK
jgi:uncharacterized membrane protein YphA (DoxX/SURF4 family)